MSSQGTQAELDPVYVDLLSCTGSGQVPAQAVLQVQEALDSYSGNGCSLMIASPESAED
jgi:hypothetical protein